MEAIPKKVVYFVMDIISHDTRISLEPHPLLGTSTVALTITKQLFLISILNIHTNKLTLKPP